MEGNKNRIIIVVAILALGGGGYGACVAMTGGAEEELTMDEGVADPGVDPPPYQAPDAGVDWELDPPEANQVELPTEPLEGVIAQPEMDELPENQVQQALPAQTVLEGVELDRRQQPCDGDPSCERERARPRDDRATSMEPGPVN